jgi:hypothetical protein
MGQRVPKIDLSTWLLTQTKASPSSFLDLKSTLTTQTLHSIVIRKLSGRIRHTIIVYISIYLFSVQFEFGILKETLSSAVRMKSLSCNNVICVTGGAHVKYIVYSQDPTGLFFLSLFQLITSLHFLTSKRHRDALQRLLLLLSILVPCRVIFL